MWGKKQPHKRMRLKGSMQSACSWSHHLILLKCYQINIERYILNQYSQVWLNIYFPAPFPRMHTRVCNSIGCSHLTKGHDTWTTAIHCTVAGHIKTRCRLPNMLQPRKNEKISKLVWHIHRNHCLEQGWFLVCYHITRHHTPKLAILAKAAATVANGLFVTVLVRGRKRHLELVQAILTLVGGCQRVPFSSRMLSLARHCTTVVANCGAMPDPCFVLRKLDMQIS